MTQKRATCILCKIRSLLINQEIFFIFIDSRTIHHCARVFLPTVNADHKCLQIYFLGNSDDDMSAAISQFGETFHSQYANASHCGPVSRPPEEWTLLYFTSANPAQRAQRPSATTLTSSFATCACDPFARTLLYPVIPRYFK